MVRADSKQDSDRPHYYSQFWIDVAQGKTSATMGAPSEAEEEEADDMAFAAPLPEISKPKTGKPAEKKPEPGRSTLTSFADLANIDMLMKNSAAMDDTMMPDITASISETQAPGEAALDYDVEAEAAEAPETALPGQEEEYFFDEEEEDEDEDWGGSRRKKPGKSKRREQHREF